MAAKISNQKLKLRKNKAAVRLKPFASVLLNRWLKPTAMKFWIVALFIAVPFMGRDK